MEEKIKNLEELLQEYIGPDKVLVEKTYANLMAPGENYLSDMQKIHLVLKNKQTGLKEEIDVVAKCAINVQDFIPTFIFTENEIAYYKKVIPALQKFREKQGLPRLDFFPQFIAGRINLTGTDQPDNDAVIVLENLKIQGYGNLDRHVGFTLSQAKAVLKDLSTLHSTALAFKLLEPETFHTEIKAPCTFKPPPMEHQKDGPPPSPPNFVPCFIQHFKSNKKFAHVVPHFEKLNERFQKQNPDDVFNPPIVEPFATLIHSDMWLNNTMQKIRDGEVVSNKLVDFQMCRIGSPSADLLFFLISSVNSEVLRKHFEALLRYYHEIFSEVLNQFGCYGPRFTYEKFMQDMRVNARSAVGQCIFMLPTAVFTEKGKAFDMKHGGPEKRIEDVPLLAREKIEILALEGCKRDWIS